MPTGYTDVIKDGISFEDFTMRCARAFGALIEMRDEPMDAEIPEFKQSTYYSESLKRSEEKLERLQNMDHTEMCDAANKEYDDTIKSELKYTKEKNELREGYNSMLLQVENWRPPTIEHTDLKRFMIEQIESSINQDCRESTASDIKKLTGDEWLELNVNSVIRNIKYYGKEHLKEIDRINKKNQWVKKLRESLSNV